VVAFIGCPMRSFYLLDRRTMTPEYQANYGVTDLFLARYETFGRSHDPLHAKVLCTGEPESNLAMLDWESWRQTEIYKRCNRLQQQGAIINAPIICDGEMVGNIHFGWRDDHPAPGASDIHLAGMLGRLVGMGLTGVRGQERGRFGYSEALAALDMSSTPLILMDAQRPEPYCNAAARELLAEITSPTDLPDRIFATLTDSSPGVLEVTLHGGDMATLHARFNQGQRGATIASLRLVDGRRHMYGGAWATLTAREREVATLVAMDHTDAQIAELLCLSRYTVSQYVRAAYRKLGVSSRVGLTRLLLTESW